MKTLFLQAPSYDGFDGSAGSCYQAKREVRSFWYPTWLAPARAVLALLPAPMGKSLLRSAALRA